METEPTRTNGQEPSNANADDLRRPHRIAQEEAEQDLNLAQQHVGETPAMAGRQLKGLALEAFRNRMAQDAKDKRAHLQIIADQVLEALKRLEDEIAHLEAEISRLEQAYTDKVDQAQVHFDHAETALDLAQKLNDGLSDQDRQDIEDLLGKSIEGKTPDEIEGLLKQYAADERIKANMAAGEANQFACEIAAKKDALKDLRKRASEMRAERDRIDNDATLTPEQKRQALENLNARYIRDSYIVADAKDNAWDDPQSERAINARLDEQQVDSPKLEDITAVKQPTLNF